MINPSTMKGDLIMKRIFFIISLVLVSLLSTGGVLAGTTSQPTDYQSFFGETPESGIVFILENDAPLTIEKGDSNIDWSLYLNAFSTRAFNGNDFCENYEVVPESIWYEIGGEFHLDEVPVYDNINYNVPGSYFIYLEASSCANNFNWIIIDVEVIEPIDITSPIITSSVDELVLELGSVEPDWTSYFSAIDNIDGNIAILNSSIIENVNMNIKGDYTVTATVVDSSNNQSTKTILVNISNDNWIVKSNKEVKVLKVNSGSYNKLGPLDYPGPFAMGEIYIKPAEGAYVNINSANELYFKYKDTSAQNYHKYFKITAVVYSYAEIPEYANGEKVKGIYYDPILEYLYVTFNDYSELEQHKDNFVVDKTSLYSVFTYIGLESNVNVSSCTNCYGTWEVYLEALNNDKILIKQDFSNQTRFLIIDDSSQAGCTVQPMGNGFLIDLNISTLSEEDFSTTFVFDDVYILFID